MLKNVLKHNQTTPNIDYKKKGLLEWYNQYCNEDSG